MMECLICRTKVYKGRELCNVHNDRLKARGRLHLLNEDIRFWEKVPVARPGECWIWTGRTDSDGYGRFDVKGDPTHAAIVAYRLLIGPVPEGMELDHSADKGCTNRLCVNVIDHIEPVTHLENVRRSRAMKISLDQRRAIYAAWVSGTPQRKLAKQYGISNGRVSQIVTEVRQGAA